jgi:hypothetical protein
MSFRLRSPFKATSFVSRRAEPLSILRTGLWLRGDAADRRDAGEGGEAWAVEDVRVDRSRYDERSLDRAERPGEYCVPPYPPDLDRADIRALGIAPVRVVGADRHGLDGDGWGCE